MVEAARFIVVDELQDSNREFEEIPRSGRMDRPEEGSGRCAKREGVTTKGGKHVLAC